jgi:hypothetical protein
MRASPSCRSYCESRELSFYASRIVQRDKAAADAIRAEQDERKRNKARVRIEEMKAKRSGATKQMPLQGKEALKAIYTE